MSTPNQLREKFKKEFDFLDSPEETTSINENVADWWIAKLEEAKKEAVEGERSRYLETNIKKLVEDMKGDAEEYGQYHDEMCPCTMEDPDDCDCETMAWVKSFTHEWMAKVNQAWVANLQHHRKHCTPVGNRNLTEIRDNVTGENTSRKPLHPHSKDEKLLSNK
jgi:hypothetical protein